jgi:transcription initiation factor IIF auxiliary subunit
MNTDQALENLTLNQINGRQKPSNEQEKAIVREWHIRDVMVRTGMSREDAHAAVIAARKWLA